MRAEDPWLVCRYSPMQIDGAIYFVTAVSLPAGQLRRDKMPQLVTYVDPRTGVEYTRTKEDFMARAHYADLDQVQEILDFLKPHHYRAVQISSGHAGVIPITMVMKSYPDARGQCLTFNDRELIKKFSANLDPHACFNSIVVGARLLEEHSATRFVRLARILGGTIWSV